MVAVFSVKVYVAQNGPTMEEDRINSRRQLLWSQRAVLVVLGVAEEYSDELVPDVVGGLPLYPGDAVSVGSGIVEVVPD